MEVSGHSLMEGMSGIVFLTYHRWRGGADMAVLIGIYPSFARYNKDKMFMDDI